jgi:hypothetical protein
MICVGDGTLVPLIGDVGSGLTDIVNTLEVAGLLKTFGRSEVNLHTTTSLLTGVYE